MFEILAVQVDRPNVAWQLLCRVVKQQGLTAATAGEHGVILARTDVAQRAGYVDVRNGVCPATLNTKILVDDSAEVFQLFGLSGICMAYSPMLPRQNRGEGDGTVVLIMALDTGVHDSFQLLCH